MLDYGTISHLKREHPDLKLYKSAKRKCDGKIFNAGDEIDHKGVVYDDYDEIDYDVIIAFDHYNHPNLGNMKRAIFYYSGDFAFYNIDDINLLRNVFDRKVIVEKYISTNPCVKMVFN